MTAFAALTATQALPPPGKAIQREHFAVALIPTGRPCQGMGMSGLDLVCVDGEWKHRAMHIVYEYDDALFEADLSWAPEQVFKPGPDGQPVPPSGSENATIFSFKKVATDLAAKRKAAIDKVAQAKADAKQKVEADAAAKRKAEEDRIASYQREQEQEKQRFANMKQALVAASRVPAAQAFVWISKDAPPSTRQDERDPAECFGWVNYFVRQSSDGAPLFAPVPRSDAAAHAKFDAVLFDELHFPMMLNPSFNAATGEWTLQVASSHCRFAMPVRIKAPGTEAVKAELLALKPGVVFQLTGETLTAKAIQLFKQDRAVYTVLTNVPVPVKLDAASVARFGQIADKMARDAQASAAAARRAEIAEMSRTYWGKVVLAISVPGAQCDQLKRVLLDYHSMGMEENQINQVAHGILNDAHEAGCLQR
ncbi:MAG: hypothetical protein ACXWC4_09300 [Telluria sp.]